MMSEDGELFDFPISYQKYKEDQYQFLQNQVQPVATLEGFGQHGFGDDQIENSS